MKNKTSLLLVIFAVSLFVIPKITMAIWWNPVSWKVFNRKFEIKNKQVIIDTFTPSSTAGLEKSTSSKTESSIKASEKKINISSAQSAFKSTHESKSNTELKIEKSGSSENILPKNTSGGSVINGATSGPRPVNSVSSSASATFSSSDTFISSKPTIFVSPEIKEICQKSYGLNPKLLGSLVSEELVLLADQLQSDCTKTYSGEQGLDINLIKIKWDSYQTLVNWDKSLLVAFISNPTSDSFRNLCDNADKVRTPFASTKIILSPDRTSMVATSVPYTLFDIMLCKDFSRASSTVVSVAPGLLQWDFDSSDSDELRTKIIKYNNLLKELELLQTGDVVAIENTVIPFVDQSNKHLITAKQGDKNQAVSFTVYNPVKWAKKIIDKPAEAIIGTGHSKESLVMHEPPDYIANRFIVMVKSVK